MKRKTLLITSIVLMVAVVAVCAVVSYAWFQAQFAGTQSLDFAIFSESIVTMDLNGTDFYSDFQPARAYKGAVAAGLDVSNIFAEPFYYSSNGSTYREATSDQLQARLALRYNAGQTYKAATAEQITVGFNLYYGVLTSATSSQIAAGENLLYLDNDLYMAAKPSQIASGTGLYYGTLTSATPAQIVAGEDLFFKEKQVFPLATTMQLVEARTSEEIKDCIYYFSGLGYAKATTDQIEEGLCIYTLIGNTHQLAGTEELQGSFIEQKAQIGVVELSFAYYGSADESSLMKLSCAIHSLWPNAPEDADFITPAEEEEPQGEEEPDTRDYWLKDISDEVSYMVCVAGTLGFDPGDELSVKSLPDTSIRVLNETRTGYNNFTLDYPGSTMYLFDCNLDHDTLYNYYGINNYATLVGTLTGSISDANISFDGEGYGLTFDSNWQDGPYQFTTEVVYEEGTFHYDVFQAARQSFSTYRSVEFIHNQIGYAVERVDSTHYNVYQTTNGIGKMNTTTTMDLQFYVFLWYNQIDEFLSPNVTFGEVGLSITVDTSGE